MDSGSTLMVRLSEPPSNRMGRLNQDKTTVQMPVPSRPERHLSATHAPVGPPTGFQRPFEIPMRTRAVIWHAERRVLPNGHKTVVFR
jgi:hypothetical protein